MTVPSPPQVGQGATCTNCPNTLRAARRTSPLPPQVLQAAALVPFCAPVPSLDGALHAGGHLGQRHLDGDPDVLAAPRLGGGAPPSPAEERLEPAEPAEVAHEDVQRLGQVHVVVLEPPAAPPEARLAVAIVRGALLRIAEHLVRLGDLLEPVFGVVRRVPVGVQVHGLLAVGLLDLFFGCAAGDAQQGVEIAHVSNPSTSWLVCSTSPMILS
jgi:hypothetical protein